MALKRDATYGGRFKPADDEHPQGGFKNRSSAQAKDGSYLEEQWLDDLAALSGSLLRAAGATLNGQVDTALKSQVMASLVEMIMGRATTLKLAAGAVKNNYLLEASDGGQLPEKFFDRMRVGFKVEADKVSDAVVNIKVGALDSKVADGEVVEGYNEFIFDADGDKFVPVDKITGGLNVDDFVQLVDVGGGTAGFGVIDGRNLTNLSVSVSSVADAIKGMSAGSVGSYCFAFNGGGTITMGSTIAGGNLVPSDGQGTGTGGALSGTWRCMASKGSGSRATLFLRIA